MKKNLITFLLAIIAIGANAQCKYCNTYEDFLADRWQELDTIYCDSHSKDHRVRWDGNKYTLTTGDKNIDSILKKNAFAVMMNNQLYVNCHNLRYNHDRFGNGYTKAVQIGQRSLLIVNDINGRWHNNPSAVVGFGIGAAMLTSKNYCYVISNGANDKGKISARLIDDNMFEQMIASTNHYELINEYYSVKETEQRLQAKHVIPILEKAGLFSQYLKNQQ